MKKIIVLLLIFFFIGNVIVYASGSKVDSNSLDESGEEMKESEYFKESLKHSGEIEMEIKKSGDKKVSNNADKQSSENEKLSEEGANVDTSNTRENYEVDAPTIILLVLFGILAVVSFILFVLKI